MYVCMYVRFDVSSGRIMRLCGGGCACFGKYRATDGCMHGEVWGYRLLCSTRSAVARVWRAVGHFVLNSLYYYVARPLSMVRLLLVVERELYVQ